MDIKNTHSVTKTEISVFGRQALDAERRRSPSLADKVLSPKQLNVTNANCSLCTAGYANSGEMSRIGAMIPLGYPVAASACLRRRVVVFCRHFSYHVRAFHHGVRQ